MRDGLPGCRADINSDVVAVGRMILFDIPSHRIHQSPHGRLLLLSHVKKTGNVSARNYQGMPRIYRIGII